SAFAVSARAHVAAGRSDAPPRLLFCQCRACGAVSLKVRRRAFRSEGPRSRQRVVWAGLNIFNNTGTSNGLIIGVQAARSADTPTLVNVQLRRKTISVEI